MISSQQTNKQAISFWLGSNSQEIAYSFYNLQAEQMFEDNEDPISQSSIWRDINKADPRMMIFDTKIDRLTQVRKVNRGKMIKKMNKDIGGYLGGAYGSLDLSSIQVYHAYTEPEKQAETDSPFHSQFDNWTDTEKNYGLIDTKHTATADPSTLSSQNEHKFLEMYEFFYKVNEQETENRIRRELEDMDYLKVVTLCADDYFCGFGSKLLVYLREQCPKQAYLLTSIANNDNFSSLPLSKYYQETEIMVPISLNPQYKWFENGSVFQNMAPYFSSLYFPLLMKESNPYSYLSTIVTDDRKLFNSAYTLPVIDEKLDLYSSTNIFQYDEAVYEQWSWPINRNKRVEKQQKGEKKKKGEKKANGMQKQEQEHQEQQSENPFRINLTNNSYLPIESTGKYLSESYILKGNFNQFETLFTPKSEPSALSIKYLSGIFSAVESAVESEKTQAEKNNQRSRLVYDPFYEHWYGKNVDSYPYHLVLFSHESFGDGIRRQMKVKRTPKLYDEDWSQSQEVVLAIADRYQEVTRSDSD